jgi:hypothetical protein
MHGGRSVGMRRRMCSTTRSAAAAGLSGREEDEEAGRRSQVCMCIDVCIYIAIYRYIDR